MNDLNKSYQQIGNEIAQESDLADLENFLSPADKEIAPRNNEKDLRKKLVQLEKNLRDRINERTPEDRDRFQANNPEILEEFLKFKHYPRRTDPFEDRLRYHELNDLLFHRQPGDDLIS